MNIPEYRRLPRRCLRCGSRLRIDNLTLICDVCGDEITIIQEAQFSDFEQLKTFREWYGERKNWQ